MRKTKPDELPAWKLWTLLAIVWSMPGLLQCLQEISYARVGGAAEPNYLRIVVHFLPTWFPWILFTPLIIRLARRFPVKGPNWFNLAIVHLPVCIAVVFTHMLLVGVVRVHFPPVPGPMPSLSQWMVNTWWSLMTQAGVMAYAGVIVVSQSWDSARALRARDVRAARLEGQLAHARFQALQAQLQPHFLFNTLNSVMVLMRVDVDRAEEMLLRLGDLLRSTLNREGVHEVSLAQEIESTRNYAEIEQVRLADRLRMHYEIEPEAEAARVPRMLLQPLVENAIQHGIAKRESGGSVVIRASVTSGALELQVQDDGVGIPEKPREGIGLVNTRARLKERYSTSHEFVVVPAIGGGTSVRIQIPFAKWSLETSRSEDRTLGQPPLEQLSSEEHPSEEPIDA